MLRTTWGDRGGWGVRIRAIAVAVIATVVGWPGAAVVPSAAVGSCHDKGVKCCGRRSYGGSNFQARRRRSRVRVADGKSVGQPLAGKLKVTRWSPREAKF